jgi:protein gp37
MLEPIREVDLTGIDWVICGGETDPMKKGRARLMDPDWARRLKPSARARPKMNRPIRYASSRKRG